MPDVYKLINATKEEACRAAEADAIREKMGESADISFDFENGKGFADAIAAIETGGARLPSEYQEVSYLRSTGEQYIDTGVYLEATHIISGDYTSYEKTRPGAFWGVYDGDSSPKGTLEHQAYITSYYTQSRLYYGLSTKRYEINLSSVSDNYKIEISGRNLYINDELIDSNIQRTNNTSATILLFNVNSNGQPWQGADMSFRSFKIMGDNGLICDFVPCYRKSDGVAGMYDLVTKQLFTNQGSGTFAVGEDV